MKATSVLTADIKLKHQDAAGTFVTPAANLLTLTKDQHITDSGHQRKRSIMFVK